jgi:hypothetical protein
MRPAGVRAPAKGLGALPGSLNAVLSPSLR